MVHEARPGLLGAVRGTVRCADALMHPALWREQAPTPGFDSHHPGMSAGGTRTPHNRPRGSGAPRGPGEVAGAASSVLVSFSRGLEHHGGAEAYFNCPRCARRATKLFLVGPRFSCRHCAALPYRSQSLEPEHRFARAHYRRRRKIDPAASQLVPGEIPLRPRYMHRRTYLRLAGAAEDAWAERQAIVLGQIAVALKRLKAAMGLQDRPPE
jgi:hypothetical protein